MFNSQSNSDLLPADADVALEVNLPAPLFRALQARLDGCPKESIDSLFAKAVTAYLISFLPGRNRGTKIRRVRRSSQLERS